VSARGERGRSLATHVRQQPARLHDARCAARGSQPGRAISVRGTRTRLGVSLLRAANG